MRLPAASPGWFDYRVYLLSDGALAVLRTDRDIDAEYQAWRNEAQNTSFFKAMPELWDGKALLVTVTETGENASISVPLIPYPRIDRFPDGRWLFASARAEAEQCNGIILESDGRPSCSFPLGDGIEHIRCAADGTLWVGYFDEGIFGDAIAAGGIVRFDANGERLWSFNDDAKTGGLFIDDCYALTLNGDELWSCFYSYFPVVRIANGLCTHWTNNISAAKALAVEGSFVLLAGGYQQDATRLSLLELGRGKSRLVGSYELPQMQGAALVQGQSSAIHVVNDAIWTRVTVSDARAFLA